MPVLENARHELFAQAIAAGKTPSEAYVAAGFMPNSGNASRLHGQEWIRKRVNEILSAMAARSVKQANYTREWVIEQLIDNVKAAKEAGDFSASNTALKMLGTERNMFVDKRETGSPGDFSNAESTDQVLEIVRKEHGDRLADLLANALGKSDDARPLEPTIDGNDTVN